MWPFRPDRLTDVLSEEDIRILLLLGEDVTSMVALVEAFPDGSYHSVSSEPTREEQRPDPFCTFFRHGTAGAAPAFDGANRACAECEQKLGRWALTAEKESPDKEEVVHRRCHMGLTDYVVAVHIQGQRVAALIAGRQVNSTEDRKRIRKIVGKLGKLTRAELASSEGKQEAPIQPASEKVRERLLQEIPQVPLGPGELPERLTALAERLSSIASRQFQGVRLRREEELTDKTEAWSREPPRSLGDLCRQASGMLELLRMELRVEYLAFFARTPRELDKPEGCPSLVAESGLGVGTRKRLLEVEWSRLTVDPEGRRDPVTLGRDGVSAAVSALRPTTFAPPDLKDRLTKSLFFAPVEVGRGLEGALAFGAADSTIEPTHEDFLFFMRLAAAMTRRYYALAVEVERHRLEERLERLEERNKRLEGELAQVETERKQARETRGFTDFDGPKLVKACLEKVGKTADGRGVEVDARSLPARLPMRAHRQLLAEAFERLLLAGIERTCPSGAEKKAAPLRVFLKRNRPGVVFGVEAVGEFLAPAERRRLLRRENSRRKPRKKEGEDGAPAESVEGTESTGVALGEVMGTARRHRGRLRLDSERLHRFEDDPKRWLGRTTFQLELPHSERPSTEEAQAKPEPQQKA